jgi:hypothetical protein
LQGPAGDFIVADHDLLLDASLSPTDLWSEEEAASYHLLPLPVGALPQPHSIEISLYESSQPNQSVVLEGPELSGPAAATTVGYVTPAVSPWRATSLYGLAAAPGEPTVRFTPALRLVGARLDRESARPGEELYVSLHWELTKAITETVRPELKLVQDGGQIAGVASAIGKLSLPPGRPAVETLAVAVPPETASGEGQVVLQAAGTVLGLGEIALEGTEHRFEPPDLAYRVDASAEPAALLGYDIAPGTDIVGGEPITVTLVWRATPAASSQDLKVFVHLVDQAGRLVAQDDAKPVDWTRPTTSWLSGEVVVDPHPLNWHQTAVEGSAHIVVGFYDEVTGQRQMWSNGTDAFELPVKLMLIQP